MFKKLGGLFKNNLYKMCFVLVFLILFSGLYLYKLGSFNRGDSRYENPNFLGIKDHSMVIHDISLAPIKFPEYLMLKIDQPNSTLLRLVSVFVLLITFIIFYRLILKWQTHRVAMLTTFLFMTSSISLALGRLTFQSVIYLLVIPTILLMGSWLRSKKYIKRVIYVLPATAILMYLPGFLILLATILIFFRKRLMAAWRFCDVKFRLIGMISAVIILLPMIYSLLKYPPQIKYFLGIDRLFDGSIPSTLINIPKTLFYSGFNEPALWLKGTAVFDIVSIVFFLLGIYAFTKSQHTLRAKVLAGLGLICIVIISLGSVANVILVVPLVYIYISKGIAFFLQNWFVVFPRNPAARNLGVSLLIIPLLLSGGYNCQRYFRAWHSAPETVQALSIK